ncbi:bifunctional enoyl-CoA hydratase/phosphate acetyltransferase [Serpentinicella alkaliphila]|uniref:Phosphate butyryltransferase n=1 Tax=Serpentinicella alkaliphila TaxID=1734049 RepID=A0A4R2T5R6_9FIRM|nr:bifunctional enoyl-CoA hydratase/phosphate acetyltransferase [Serpentinicella alkaliphila]QUH24389.1 bifunctional enoyl-CoA hydratase/phosphate acetyltransferase [Serpentinicella alkaliphila]TCP98347.1 phosphate butyryltransferase [Serpentinicella alkaliphila]
MIRKLDDLLKKAQEQKTMRLAVAAAHDEDVLQSIQDAFDAGIVEPILIGDLEKMQSIAKELEVDLTKFKVVDIADFEAAAIEAARLVSTGEADFLMKGILDTSILLKAVLKKDFGLRTDNLISHVLIYEPPTYHKLLTVTDGGMNITPSLDEKASILQNAVDCLKAMGREEIKVACIAAKEKVSDKMQATLDGAELKKYSLEGRFGPGVIVEGPIAFDLAVSTEAAKIKNYESDVSGDADVLLVPTIEVGNGIGKSLTYMANAKSAGIIMGARVPVVLVSRADSAETKLYSIALGSLISAKA